MGFFNIVDVGAAGVKGESVVPIASCFFTKVDLIYNEFEVCGANVVIVVKFCEVSLHLFE